MSMWAARRVLRMHIEQAGDTGPRHGPLWRFAIRFRNRMPVIAWLWRSTWEEWAQ